jgi:uncharacterized protein YbcV (DUF1398 family)
MFTIEQIREAFEKVKSGADFPQFVHDLKAIGVIQYDNFVSDGRAIYYGIKDFAVEGKPKYQRMEIKDIGSAEKLKHAISIHQQGQTDYLTFCKQAAEAGVEKWTTHMIEMTVTYLDKKGSQLTVEAISKK